MSWILATAAGKDATLALHRARDGGLEVDWGLGIVEESSGLVRFHGIPRALLEAHVRALGLEPLVGAAGGGGGFEAAFGELLERARELGARGVLFGNLHLVDIRAWYEERVTGAGLEYRDPLWGTAPERVVRDVVELGYRALVTSVNLDLGDPAWLGRELTPELLAEFEHRGIDPAGERGEYHTFVHDGPEFRSPVRVREVGREEREGHRYLRLGQAGGP